MTQKEKKNHIMLDIETLATGANAVIVSIGAVKFIEPEDQQPGEDAFKSYFYEKVDVQSCLNLGMEVDSDTISWWMWQDDEACKVFKDVGIPLHEALFRFEKWIGKDPIIWGKGADFDNAIMRQAYRRLELECPWHYRNSRCYRTMAARYPSVEYKQLGTAHNAVHDAQSQASHLLKIMKLEHEMRVFNV